MLSRNDLRKNEAIYQLTIKNLSGYMEACYFCSDKRCDGCPLPFDKNLTLQSLLDKIGIDSNISFYEDGYNKGKKELIFEILWNTDIENSFFNSF